ncbi:hypothetical protein NPIL_323131 [Nephila pilipes]|uniref:Uncharacterized protein n=1 Tax=Nephila pilipes TaxID=299642 RepID=A0A8X6R3P5_NEPPI|nr:hypothetical protein NPIL_323131 [Nephila pilipes]
MDYIKLLKRSDKIFTLQKNVSLTFHRQAQTIVFDNSPETVHNHKSNPVDKPTSPLKKDHCLHRCLRSQIWPSMGREELLFVISEIHLGQSILEGSS